MRIFSAVSGTSCDGISWCLAGVSEKEGRITFEVIDRGSSRYPASLRRALLGAANSGHTTLSELCEMHWSIGRHLERAGARLKEAPDAGVFSGHTMYHTEQIGRTGKGTFQIGAVEPLSVSLGIPVMDDMRSTDVAAGGMGAPLVPRADEIMFGKGTAVLNIGGIANVTLLGRKTTGFDTGPGNMLIDEAARSLFGREMDQGGRLASSGRVNNGILHELLKDRFVNARPPKSCGRERYGSSFLDNVLAMSRAAGMSNEDIMSTVTEFTAASIIRNMEKFAPAYRRLVVAGGGAFNRHLTKRIRSLFKGNIHISEEYCVPRDARESLAFAILCYLSMTLRPSNSDATGARRKLPLGKVTVSGLKKGLV